MKAKKSKQRESEAQKDDSRNVLEGLQRLAQEKRAILDANKPSSAASAPIYPYLTMNPDFPLHKMTWDYLDSTLDFEPTGSFNWRDHAAKAAHHYTRQGLDHLTKLVFASDDKAIAALADIAIGATMTLSGLSDRAPKQVSPIACHRFFWPFLKARKKRFGDDHERLVKQIELGYEAPFSEEAVSRIRANNTAVRTAMMLLCRIESARCEHPAVRIVKKQVPDWEKRAWGLKSFSNETRPAWFEVSWKALLADHNGHPERDPDLRKIGLYRAEHSFEMGAQERVTQRTREGNIQNGIKEKLKAAVTRLGVKKSNK